VLSLVLAGVLLAEPVQVPIPGGEGGIGFDDLVFSAPLRRFIVPGGRTGSVFLMDPASRHLEPVGALTKFAFWKGGHSQSATSADARSDVLFVADRTTKRLFALPVDGKGTPAATPLESDPDYVRWVETTGEVWVTEPDAAAIEIFRFDPKAPALVHSGRIPVRDGPESLVIDTAHGRAFTNTWHDRTLAVGLKERSVIAQWKNGCKDARGLDADRQRGLLFVGCAEGMATVIDTAGKGKLAGQATTGGGVDIIAYAPSTRRLYVPSGRAATLEVFEVQADGSLRPLWRGTAAQHSHCVAVDDGGHVVVCDPPGGRLLFYEDGAGRAQ
jgi:hypothetical protein